MHRRRHKVLWKLLKQEIAEDQVIKKKVFVCPEHSCLHHDPCNALGDLVEIKKNTLEENTSTTSSGSATSAPKATPCSPITKHTSKPAAPEDTHVTAAVSFPEWKVS
ncbi:hypothetical protein ACFX2I_007362 [Malus domestica]